MKLPDGRLVAFYGDDYTGSTAVMEVLSFSGLRTVLFLSPPTPKHMAPFRDYRAVGIAGVARAKDPSWMDRHLPDIFRGLRALQAPIAHYKICSTFDSAPQIGSIGRAIDIGAPILGADWHPMIVAAPPLGRYQAFGNLFAVADGVVHRLDRHPTMAHHPVTPMGESDVRLHLSRQTDRKIGLIDVVAMTSGMADERLAAELRAGAEIITLDVLDEATLVEAGRLLWERRGDGIFAIGSQGVEYALVAYWRAAGLIAGESPSLPAASAVDRLIAVSGSCSPVTAAQIDHACANSFMGLRLDGTRAVDAAAWQNEIQRGVDRALSAASAGVDPLLYTAKGPDDPAVAAVGEAARTAGVALATVNDRIGQGLGSIVDQVMRRTGLSRALIAGGDTSGHATSALGVHALEAVAPIAAGAPLCRAYADDPAHRNLELVLKGGQMGRVNFFTAVKVGRPYEGR